MPGSSGGFQIALGDLVTFQKQVTGLLNDIDTVNTTKHGTSLGADAFGNFDEAHALWQRHEKTRVVLEQLLTRIEDTHQSMVDAASRSAGNYQASESGNQQRITDSGSGGSGRIR